LPAAAGACFIASAFLSGGAAHPVFPSPGIFVGATLEILILGGPLGEEPGWRGFLLPELRKSTGPFLASMIVGFAWFVWHLPLFWVPGAAQQEIPMAQFALALLAYSFILTWLFESSTRSTFVAIVFHTSANVTFWLAAASIKDQAQNRAFWPLYFGALCILGIGAALSRALRRQNQVVVGATIPRQ